MVTLTLNLLSQFLLVVLIAAVLFFRNWHLALLALAIAPVDRADCAGLPAHRSPDHAALAALAGARQCQRAGGRQRHHGRQELPPGAEHV